MESSEAKRTLSWDHGALTVQRLGAMLAPVRFDLQNGQSVEPMHIPPWADEALPMDLPPILRGLRGEWPCVPFGADEPANLSPAWQPSMGRPSRLPAEAPPHGESSNSVWDWQSAEEGTLRLRLIYPADHPIRWVERIIEPDPDAPAINLTLKVMPRADCDLPIGFHPTFTLPTEAGASQIVPPKAHHIRSYPGTLEPGADIFANDAVFENLREAPAPQGGAIDASCVPFQAPGEDLLQLVGVEAGRVGLINHSAAYRVDVSWNAQHFPSLLIWYSNRGRRHTPWSGRHTALGLEPVCSAFDLGDAIATGDNPIALLGVPTATKLRAGELFQTDYRIAAQNL